LEKYVSTIEKLFSTVEESYLMIESGLSTAGDGFSGLEGPV
jgi:hypothetical protein